MKVSELSRRTGVQVPLIKHYLRQGLLHPGRATASNQADYGEDHVHRLRFIRTLIGIRGLSIGATKEILDAITAEQDDLHQVFGIVLGVRPTTLEEHTGTQQPPTKTKAKAKTVAGTEPGSEPTATPMPTPVPTQAPVPAGLADARMLIAEMEWDVSPGNPAAHTLAEVLAALGDLGADIDWRGLLPYARLADSIADVDVRQMHGERDLLAQAERAVLVSVLLEPALLALRRLAQESKSARHFGGGGNGGSTTPAAG
ncbi:MerR family transcriptional regulator (plasmid) [Streptomyces yangpuensis]|uniref:MerR family transcriptional regulator n=1 Tax=Streptomyces yangpuensis TaxID=1648182 RepID=A0ABY5Q896_9ACTN|nr:MULTISPECIES: MerR family transcriptional regulator [Streptomyces]UUY52676.1 MerR family transcriptional regulator [Streptomyces yangpuensis]